MSSLVSEKMAQSSTKSEAKSSKDATPRMRLDLSPDVTPSARVREVGLATGHSIVPSAACMIKRKRMGPLHAPCRTPIELPTAVSSSPISTLSRTSMPAKWPGMLNSLSTSQRAPRFTVPNALTKSTYTP